MPKPQQSRPALLEQHRVAEAIDQFQAAIEINPAFRGSSQQPRLRLPASQGTWTRPSRLSPAIDADPKYVHAYNNLGLALAMQGKLDEAIAGFQQRRLLDPTMPPPRPISAMRAS